MQHQSRRSCYNQRDSESFSCPHQIILERVVDESKSEYKQMQQYEDTHETEQKLRTAILTRVKNWNLHSPVTFVDHPNLYVNYISCKLRPTSAEHTYQRSIFCFKVRVLFSFTARPTALIFAARAGQRDRSDWIPSFLKLLLIATPVSWLYLESLGV